MAIDLLKYMIWRNGAGGGGKDYEEKTVGPAPILHIEDALKRPLSAYTFDVNPVQDLNGQSSPYPAGGGKNLYKDTFDGWTKPVNYWIYPVSLSEGTYKLSATLRTGKTAVEGATVGFAKSGTQYTDFDAFVIALNTAGKTVDASPVTITSSDSPVLAFYGTEELFYEVMDAYEIQLEAGSSSTSYVPYSNICPIYGWKTVNVWNDPKYGGNIEFNQWFIAPSPSVLSSGITFERDEAKTTSTFYGTATSTVYKPINETPQTIINHYYYVDKGSTSTAFRIYNDNGGVDTTVNSQYGLGKATAAKMFYFNILNGSVVDETVRCQIIDLTQMFGAGNEPTTVDEFRALFPKAYYPYNAGEHTCVSAVNGGAYGKYPITFGAVGKNLLPMGDISINDSLYAHSYTSSNYQNFSIVIDAMKSIVGKTVVYSAKTTGTASGVAIGQIRFVKGSDNLFSLNPNQSAEVPDVDWDGVTNIIIYGSGTGATISDLQIELGTTPSSYEPYTDTVYGGVVDVVNSTVTVTHSIVDLGTLSWTMVGSYAINRFDALVPGMTDSKTAPYSDGILCSAYNPSNVPITQVNVDATIARYSGRVFVCDSAYSDAASFKSGVSGVQFLYELATPQTYTITPETVITLYKGENNLWADSGDSTGTYVSSDPYKETAGPAQIISVTNALKKPAVSLVASMTPIQDLHGYESPWPAGGNYNKLSAASAFTQSDNGITLRSDSMGVYALSGTATADFSYKFNIPEMIMPSTVYVHIMNSAGGSSGGAITLEFYNGATREDYVGFGTSSYRKYNGTTALGGKTINALQIKVANGEAISGTLTFSPMVLLANDTVPFAPYSNECPISGRTEANIYRYAEYDADAHPTYTIQLGQTVYGCTVDVVTGVLTATKAFVEYDGSADEPWQMFGSGSASAYAMLIVIANFKFVQSVVTAWSNYLESIDNGKTWGNYDAFMSCNAVGVVTGIRTITSVAEWRAYLANHPLQVVYELDEPQTYQLTPQQVQMLKGVNTLWSDADDLTLTYLAKKETQSLWNFAPLLFGGLNLGNALNDTNQETPQETVVDSVDGDPNEEE